MKHRLIAYVGGELHSKVVAAGSKPGQSQSAIIEMALKAYFSLALDQVRESGMIRRQDDILRALARIERDQQAHMEMTDLIAWYELLFSPPMTDEQIDAAVADTRKRHARFRKAVQNRLGSGRKLLGEALADAVFSEDDFVSVQDRRQ
ncbi:MAG: hypothetical protein V7675_08125 [Hyphomonas sp.]|uniref:hypothetical protein n=1 Tax=Hyphomonas sp. TaxID=87 RepID=UPI00300235F1